jgi:hypothetical protein
MNSKSVDLWRASPLTFFLERLFYIMQFASLGNVLFGTRATAIEKGAETILRRARLIEVYSCGWLLLDIGCAIVAGRRIGVLAIWAGWLSLFHVFEMCHSAVNIGIFDQLRIPRGVLLRMASVERVLILTAVNFIQVSVCFATFYCSQPTMFNKRTDRWSDAFYFSGTTQLTIGYGDIYPSEWMRSVAIIQGFVGFFFAVAVITRFVSFLPGLTALKIDERDS